MFGTSKIMVINTAEPDYIAALLRIFPVVLVNNNLFPSQKNLSLSEVPSTEIYIRSNPTMSDLIPFISFTCRHISTSNPPYWYSASSKNFEHVQDDLLTACDKFAFSHHQTLNNIYQS